jgi:phage tail protein X
MALSTYTTVQGDMLDRIAWTIYGDEGMAVDILEANPRLSDHGPVLPMGLTITLPARREPKATAPITLWS